MATSKEKDESFRASERSAAQVAVFSQDRGKNSKLGPEERRVILIGKIGAGKSHTGNGLLGKQHFVSKRCWSSVTRRCEYGVGIRNGFLYRIYDTPGMSSPKDAGIDVESDIRRCLFCTSPGFHAIVLVLSAAERITAEDMKMLELLDKLLEESAFKYMILVISKLENDESQLTEMMSEAKEVVELNVKCSGRHVIFGDSKKKIPSECVLKFDDMLTNLIKENSRRGKEHYTHKYYDKATKILEKDKKDYMKENPEIPEGEAMEIVRNRAAEGLSPRDGELKAIDDCCIIS
ncbi:GTPase IMAP family member 4-like [Saccostrea echinata]|uniref:GTPase IMAP family member 4-like n=1 Tax=Saccostrea echinata TaxID=191078 RepID=UPI002A83E296|nr:GTPase IMAP family member 4-like [Saccostrea echinata]